MVSDAQAAALVVATAIIILAIRLRTSGAQRMLVALARGEPREFRARARLLGGTGARQASSWAALYEAIGLFWEGSFDRALAITRRIGLPHAHRSILVIALDVQCLILSGRVAEARGTFDLHRARLLTLGPNVFSIAGGTTIEGMLWFHEGELERSRARLEIVRSTQRRPSPARRLVDFYLAAIAHREGRADDASAMIEAVRRGGGAIFVMRQASDAREEISRAAASTQLADSLTEAPHKARRRRHTAAARLLARG
ncbi:MAG: hypothetical protein JWM74_2658, partial [Myxococcaceae bacterium]|nr:hypothetical protein [Myxococcaceae bacterium]